MRKIESILKKISKYYLWGLPLVLTISFLAVKFLNLKGAYLKYYYFGLFIIYIGILLMLKVFFLHIDLVKVDRSVNRTFAIFFIITSVCVYIIIFSILTVLKYNAYNMGMIDFGRMVQAVWNTINGRLLMNTWDTGNISRLAGHVEFIFVPISLVYLLFSDPRALLILQTIAIAFGGIAIYRIATYILKSRSCGFCFLLAFFMYPSIQYPNLIDFHPDMLALSFLLFTFYYSLKKRWLFYYVFLLLSLFCREYVSIVVIMLGIYLTIFEHDRKVGLITVFVGALWFILAYKIIPPYFNKGGEIATLYHYESIGNTTEGVFKNIIFHPIKVFSEAIRPIKISYFILLLLPLGFLSFFGLSVFVIGIPVLTGLFLTENFSYANHHNAVIIPFIFISTIKGVKWISDKFRAASGTESVVFHNTKYAVCAYLLSCSLFSALLYSPGPLSVGFWNKSSYHNWLNLHQFKVTEHDRIADKFVKMVPPEVRVSASNHLASHLSQRETIYQFPHPENFQSIDYILVDLIEYYPTEWNRRKEERATLRKLILNGNFTLKAWEDGILLLQKGLKKKESYYLNASFAKDASPRFIINYAFADRLLLKGFDLNYDKLMPGSKNRIIYYWQVLKDFGKEFTYSYFGSTERLSKDFILIDTFKSSSEELRIVHLPLYILYPPEDWKEGDVIKEEFEFYLPGEFSKGNYTWKIGCYVAPEYYFIQTGQKNLIPGTKEIKINRFK